MDRIYLFLIRNDVWIYIISVMGLVWYLTEFIRAQRLLRRAMFNLERETATSVRNHALSFILFFIAVIGIVYYVNRNIAPELPAELMLPPTPTPNIFATPLSSPTPLGTTAAANNEDENPILAATVTLPPLPGFEGFIEATPEIEGTVEITTEPEASPTPFASCIPSLMISEPLNGGLVFQQVNIRGTADTGPDHQYIIELNGPQTVGLWAPIMEGAASQPIVNGDLASADLSQWERGPYLVRLRALSTQGGELGVCTIQFTLDN
jgi:hypothetical protein